LKSISLLLLLLSSTSLAHKGDIPASEVSIGGISVGQSPAAVMRKLGKPFRETTTSDYLDLHFKYRSVTVSFSEKVVAGLYSDQADGCTPKHLCPGNSLKKMRSLYGFPIEVDRETGHFYEYYGQDLYCWLQISAKGQRISSIAVACQP
jgi:hypothetical protein